MQTLPILIAEMRMMGVKRLELELDAAPEPDRGESKQWADSPELERDTERPAEAKPEGSCAALGCVAPRGGLMGGAVAPQFCRAHALAEAGVKR